MNEIYNNHHIYGLIELFNRMLRLINIVIKRGDKDEINVARMEISLMIGSMLLWKETVDIHRSLRPHVKQLIWEIEASLNAITIDESDIPTKDMIDKLKMAMA